jgi:hypothetical protein
MNQLKKQLLCLTALISAGQLFGDAGTTTQIVPRSQSFNAARQMVGWNNPNWGINRYPQDKYYSSFNATFAYTRTFRDDRLTRALFGDDLVCGECDDLAIKISGSAIENRASTDWLADNFGLPRNFQSTVSFKPTISNFILDFSFYAGFDAWLDGSYFRVHAPFVHTKWNLNAKESVSQIGSDSAGSYFQGYFSSNTVPVANMNTQFLNYANGCVPRINNDYNSADQYTCLTSGNCTELGDITWNSLCCSRISNDCDCDNNAMTRNGLAEIRAVLGWNFLNDEEEQYHVGIGIYAAAPTGTKIGSDKNCDGDGHGRYLFEPIVGNGHHWELGAQITAHHIFWNSQDASKSLGVYLEANATHLFAASQVRCFDLDSAGSNSRYMIAQLLDSNRNSSPRLGDSVDAAGLEFANVYAPVANITRRNVSSIIAVQGDVALSLAYQSGNFQWDVGYNFWGRTCEDLCIDNCCPTPVGNWALKGDQRVYGFVDDVDRLAVKLAVSDSRATINAGSNMLNGISYTDSVNPPFAVNAYANNAVLAEADSNEVFQSTDITSDTRIYTSNPVVLIQESDFDLSGTKGTSNKVFTNFNWKWDNNSESKFAPYLSLGGEIEFGSTDNGCSANDCKSGCDTGCNTSCNTSCNTGCNTTYSPISVCDTTPCPSLPRRQPNPENCINCALSQWGIWFKIGASYN